MNFTPPTSLRIALVTETFAPEVNGVAMTLGRLVDGLLTRGHQLQLVRPHQGSAEQHLIRDGLNEVLVAGLPLPGYKDMRFGWPASALLQRRWRQTRPDIVHVATEGPLGWSAISAAKALGLPVSSSFHTNFHNYSQHYGVGLFHRPIAAYLRRLHNRTLVTLAPTLGLVKELQAQGYQHVGVMSRGVDTTLFNPSRRSAALRTSWGVTDNDVVVSCVGRLAKEKSVATVLEAFTAIRSQYPRTKLLLVGDGPLRAALQAACPEAIFAGVQKGEALATFYASSDLFIFPSLSETFGNVVPEALASGLAVVAYNHAAAADLIADGQNGRLAGAGDATQLIHIALEVANSPAQMQALRQCAAPSIAHLQWAAVYDGFVASLQSAIARHHAAVPRPTAQVSSLNLPSA